MFLNHSKLSWWGIISYFTTVTWPNNLQKKDPEKLTTILGHGHISLVE